MDFAKNFLSKYGWKEGKIENSQQTREFTRHAACRMHDVLLAPLAYETVNILAAVEFTSFSRSHEQAKESERIWMA